jgi:hypothetical protein
MADSTSSTTSSVSFPAPHSDWVTKDSLIAYCDIFSICTIASNSRHLVVVSIDSLEMSTLRISTA